MRQTDCEKDLVHCQTHYHLLFHKFIQLMTELVLVMYSYLFFLSVHKNYTRFALFLEK